MLILTASMNCSYIVLSMTIFVVLVCRVFLILCNSSGYVVRTVLVAVAAWTHDFRKLRCEHLSKHSTLACSRGSWMLRTGSSSVAGLIFVTLPG